MTVGNLTDKSYSLCLGCGKIINEMSLVEVDKNSKLYKSLNNHIAYGDKSDDIDYHYLTICKECVKNKGIKIDKDGYVSRTEM